MKTVRLLLLASLVLLIASAIALGAALASTPKVTDAEIKLLEETQKKATEKTAPKTLKKAAKKKSKAKARLTQAININQADAGELQLLKGIGPKKAQAIIDYRQKHGPFQRPADVVRVKGVGPKTLQKNLKWIAVE